MIGVRAMTFGINICNSVQMGPVEHEEAPGVSAFCCFKVELAFEFAEHTWAG